MKPVRLKSSVWLKVVGLGGVLTMAAVAHAQLIDRTLIPNPANEGIAKSLTQQVGAGRGNVTTVDSSIYIIKRDPARSIRRGRQIFQRKFNVGQGFGPRTNDGVGGNIVTDGSLGAGLADSCAACHGRPRGSAGFGGDVATRPDSRDAPHLFGLGLQEQLADEITAEIRAQSDAAKAQCQQTGTTTQALLRGRQGEIPVIGSIDYGRIVFTPSGTATPVYRLRMAHSGKCVEVTGGGLNDGDDILQRTCDTALHQQWKQINLGGNIRQFEAVHSAKCMDVQGGVNGIENGRIFHQWRCHGNTNQRFELVDRGQGRFQLKAVHSGKCLDVDGNSTADGAVVHQWTCKSSTSTTLTNQLVTIEQVGTIGSNTCTANTSEVRGVNPDLRVRPFFAQGGTISIREFLVGAFNAEMGLEAPDPDLLAAAAGGIVTTPSGMVLDGTRDAIEAPPVSSTTQDGDGDGKVNEIPTAIVDHMEFYLLNYFKPGRGEIDEDVLQGEIMLTEFRCTNCHVKDLTIRADRRVADVETVFNPGQGNPFNRLFATASLRLVEIPNSGTPPIKDPARQPFVVRNIHTDFKRHNMGKNFAERNYNSTAAAPNLTMEFITEPLWGVGDTPPYGHDGRSGNLNDVILRHNSAGADSDAIISAQAFAGTSEQVRIWVRKYLASLILFSPDDTASNLQVANPSDPNYPQFGHGSIRLVTLFNNPNDLE